MAGLADFRKQYPQYHDMSDGELADALYAAHYSDMPRKDFDASIGMRTSQGQGFAKGVYEVSKNLAPLIGVMNPAASNILQQESGAELKGIAARENAGVRSGGKGEFAGKMIASAPTMFVGGPAISGALQGYATSDAKDIGGKAIDSALGAVGGKIGAKVLSKVTNVLAPAVDGAVSRLAQRGVRMTPGQVRGGKAMIAEDKLMSLPIVGDAIREGRNASIYTFNRAAVNRALEPLGVKLPDHVPTGHDAIDFAHQAVSDAYNTVVPKLTAKVDPRFVAGMKSVYETKVAGLSDGLQKTFDNELKNVRFGPGGTLAGDKVQGALSDLRKLAKDYGTSATTSERKLGDAFGEVARHLEDMVVRQNPEIAPAFKAANKAFRGLAIVEKAAAGADNGIFTTGQLKQAVKAADGSARKSAVARGAAFMQDLSNDARNVLPSKTPDSGTAGRLQTGIISNIRGAAALAKLKTDQAYTSALAQADPEVIASVRQFLKTLQRPAAFAGSSALSTRPK